MTYMLVRNKVRDYQEWRRVFDEQNEATQEAGMEVLNVWQSMNDPNEVHFLLKVSSVEKANAYVNDPASAEVGQRAGVIDGDLTFIVDAD